MTSNFVYEVFRKMGLSTKKQRAKYQFEYFRYEKEKDPEKKINSIKLSRNTKK